MDTKQYEAEAEDIVRWVKTWRTWRKDYDEQAAFDAVLGLVSLSCPVPSVIYAKGMNREERERVHRVRYALGCIAIEAAKADVEAMAEWEELYRNQYAEFA
jgi:hypothetical protein